MSFPCTGCGECCKRAGRAVQAARHMAVIKHPNANLPFVKEVAAFPYSFDKHGRCEMLNEDNTCRVYATRPDICSIEKTWMKYHSAISQNEYYQKVIATCNEIMDEVGSDIKYRINGKESQTGNT